MNAKIFSDAMSELDDRYIEEVLCYRSVDATVSTSAADTAAEDGTIHGSTGKLADTVETTVIARRNIAYTDKPNRTFLRKKTVRVRVARVAVTAACIIALLTGISVVNRQLNRIPLSDKSSNVTAYYTSNPFMFFGAASSGCLTSLTEEELFTEFDTAILKGTIAQIRNIVVNFNGEREYRAIAEIKVEKVYRGTCKEGETVSVLLPCAITPIVRVTGSDIITDMKAGMTGIFMPIEYDDKSSRWMENGAELDKRELADYGFADGERYVFLETNAGLVFDRDVYKSISNATTLEEVEEYIENMLESLNE